LGAGRLQVESTYHEANLPAEQDPPEACARFPGADANEGRPARVEKTASKGAQAVGGCDRFEVAMAEPRERFSRASRLRRSQEFQRAARLGERKTSQHFVVLLAPRGSGDTPEQQRLGVTVSRRIGNAVVRNRVKRGIREWFRRRRGLHHQCGDLVVIARQGAARLSVREISEELNGALK
jgi:ribonuclease P protein component